MFVKCQLNIRSASAVVDVGVGRIVVAVPVRQTIVRAVVPVAANTTSAVS